MSDFGDETRPSEPPDRPVRLIIRLEFVDDGEFVLVALVFVPREVN